MENETRLMTELLFYLKLKILQAKLNPVSTSKHSDWGNAVQVQQMWEILKPQICPHFSPHMAQWRKQLCV